MAISVVITLLESLTNHHILMNDSD
jgi:hypothetical protein